MNRQAETAPLALHHRIVGDSGPVVLLIHGLFGDGDNLGALARQLATSHRAVLVDLRNHGRSPHADSMSLAEMAADVAQLQRQLGVERCAIVGHSLGGKVAMQLALTQPERVAQLVVADIAPVRYPPHHNEVLAALAALELDRVESRADADRQLATGIDDKGVRLFLLKSLQRDRDSGRWGWAFNLPALIACYNNQLMEPPQGEPFSGPTLFIKGELSNYITAEHREVMERLFPQLQFRMIAGTGHWLHGEKPAAFNRLVEQFLAG